MIPICKDPALTYLKSKSIPLESVGLSQDKKKYVWLSVNRMIAGDL
jgi:hypothetical protein